MPFSCRLAALAVAGLLAAQPGAATPTFVPDWGSCGAERSTAASILVAVDPEWSRSGRLHAVAVEAVRTLARSGAGFLRFLNFNIFPGISCAQLEPGKWDFSIMDEAMADFMDAAGNASVIIDIETSPAFMWRGSNASTNHTCANATSTTLPVGPRERCPFFGDPTVPVDPSWSEIAGYFKRVGDWYTQGGFHDEQGGWHGGGHHYKIDRWEILNEVNHPREHDFTPESYIAMYDEQVRVMTASDATPPADAFLGPSLAGLAVESADAWIGPILNRSSHSPTTTPVGGVSFHAYAMCDNNTAAGMEKVFPATDARISAIVRAETLRDELRPDAELHLTESGILCNSPRWCDVNNYTCWYRDFSPAYWAASAGQWVYQFLTFSKAARLASVAQSQVLGYPYRFDGLSGEWPCGSMIDWDAGKPNAKLWVEVALLEHAPAPFRYCGSTLSTDDVYAQALTASAGRQTVVLVNKRQSPRAITVQGASGKRATFVDEASGNGPGRVVVLSSDTVTLDGFATAMIAFA